MTTQPTEPSTTPAKPAPVKRPILIVDDEPEMLFSVRNLLRREFDVHTASSGAEGIQILQEHEIHLVITDQRMPEMSGVEFLRRIKCEHPGAMRLIFTGFADIRAVIDAINQGNVFRYITKPWDPEDLLAALRDAGQRYDLIAGRNQLLNEMRAYEASCIAFKDDLLSGKLGSLIPQGVTEAERLLQSGRELLGRLDRTLKATQHEPMS